MCLGQREGIDPLWHFSHGNARNLFKRLGIDR
jgi:hypothetical protein